MATTADIRNGLCIELNSDILKVIDFQKFQVGRGSGKVWTKLKSTTSGKVIEHTFQSGHNITEVRVERRKFQYLYPDDGAYVLMNQETYDQVHIPKVIFGEAIKFLQEGMILTIRFDENEKPLSGNLPKYAELVVTYTEEGVKGKLLKPAEVEGGIKIQVPLFVNIGDKLKISIDTSEYIERVK